MSTRVLLLLLFALVLLPVTGILAGEESAERDALRAKLKAVRVRMQKSARGRERLQAEERKLLAALKVTDPEVLWTLDLQSDSKGSGHIADLDHDGKPEIVFGTYFSDEHVYCVKGTDGSVLWKHKSEHGPFDASVAILDVDAVADPDAGPEIFAADSATGRLYCLDGEGAVRWEMKLPSGTDSPPALADLDGDGLPELVIGTMWDRNGVGRVCAIDPRKGEFLWQVEVKGCVQSEPVLVDLDGDKRLDVIVTSWRGDRCVHALSGKDGSTLWTFETAGDDKSMGMYHGVSAVHVGEALRLIVPTCEGDVYALDAKGKEIWRKTFEDYLFAPSTVADFDGDEALEVFVAGRRAYLLDVATGDVEWTVTLAGSVARGAAAADTDGDRRPEIIVSAGTTAYVLDGATGLALVEFQAALDPEDRHEKIACAPLVADLDGDGTQELFVVCGRGYSGKLAEQNGARAYAVRLGPGVGSWNTFRGWLRRTGQAPPWVR